MAESFSPLFVSHGAPTLCVEDNATTRYFSSVLNGKGSPTAVLVVSAHWQTDGLRVTHWKTSPLLYDFYGFPEPLYRMRYPAPGSPELAESVRELCKAAGLGPVTFDEKRGLDHGAWVPLLFMLPRADVPVVQLSLPQGWKPSQVYELGRTLALLREQGVLLLGSGGAVHNLSTVVLNGTAVADWARVFEEWLCEALAAWNTQDLFDYWRMAPHGVQAHPSEEHFLPLLFPMGVSDEARSAKILHREFMHGTLSMLSAAFE
jgi:4,5-DOPA dioxygenase extradiol